MEVGRAGAMEQADADADAEVAEFAKELRLKQARFRLKQTSLRGKFNFVKVLRSNSVLNDVPNLEAKV